jgi:hypothetical protein
MLTPRLTTAGPRRNVRMSPAPDVAKVNGPPTRYDRIMSKKLVDVAVPNNAAHTHVRTVHVTRGWRVLVIFFGHRAPMQKLWNVVASILHVSKGVVAA